MIIENPYSTEHYLTKYWCLEPSIIDKNRWLNGDYYEKPTQYWFLNCKPKDNLFFEPMILHKKKRITAKVENGGENDTASRSLISKEYANKFIRTYVLEG